MRLATTAFLLATAFITLGCATGKPHVTKAEVDHANAACDRQIEVDQILKKTNWFSRWIECKRRRLMPLEKRIYPGKEKDIERMYERLLFLAERVDLGVSRVEPIYAEWDRMYGEIGMRQCLLRVSAADGSSRCLKP